MLAIIAVALLMANIINVGADLSGMADAGEMLTGLNSHWLVVFFGVLIAFATVWFRYHQIASVLKWLAGVLFAYVIPAFLIHPDWSTSCTTLSFLPCRMDRKPGLPWSLSSARR